MSNSGKKLLKCEKCNRKRFCVKTPIRRQYWYKWTCSKGHSWVFKHLPASLIVAQELNRIKPKLKKLFKMDNIFYKALRKAK